MSQYIIRRRKFLSDIPVDDLLMLVLVFIYTTAIAALYKYFDIFEGTDFDALTSEENVAIGRKLGILNILAETAIQTTLWGNKCCILLLYNRLTYVTVHGMLTKKGKLTNVSLFGHYHKTWIIVATYTGLAYLAVIVALYGGWCRPFSDYMEMEPENGQSWQSIWQPLAHSNALK
ncbi:hypothetical protein CSUB01_03538 [Colletotrichum sublineola]|uniref:Uncharacterized protein n=1 Tax=Colletotrichum sublineola TaxID=1173701 RepID=A0A066XGT8_COLSU|nr:hypothetical protein CSUB01_03538 [Colletotrichum sublineola]